MNRKDMNGEVTHEMLEEGSQVLIDFDKLKKAVNASESPVIPAVAQDAKTKEVLIIGYANEEALRKAIEVGKATFWSTSRNELWVKGLTSGDYLELEEIRVNCEQNSILYLVNMVGKGSCHTKDENGNTRFGCYYRKIEGEELKPVE